MKDNEITGENNEDNIEIKFILHDEMKYPPH